MSCIALRAATKIFDLEKRIPRSREKKKLGVKRSILKPFYLSRCLVVSNQTGQELF